MELLASSYDQSRFLNAADLQREKKFRIKEVTEETVGEKQERKPVVWFTNHAKGLVLNKTNNRTIRGAFGDPLKGWINKIIIIFPTHVDMRGKSVPALRVRIPPPKEPGVAPAAPQQPQQPGGNSAAAAPPPQQAAAVAGVAPLPKQATTAAPAATTSPPPKPAPSGNGAAAAAPQSTATAAVDPELADDPVPSLSEDLDDEIPFSQGS